jgi:Zn-dependent metalloprotease
MRTLSHRTISVALLGVVIGCGDASAPVEPNGDDTGSGSGTMKSSLAFKTPQDTAIAALAKLHEQNIYAYFADLDPVAMDTAMAEAEAVGLPLSTIAVEFDKRGSVRGLWAYKGAWATSNDNPDDPAASALAFLATWSDLFLGSGDEMEVIGAKQLQAGGAIIGLKQVFNGIELYGSSVLVDVMANGSVRGLRGRIIPKSDFITSSPALDEKTAEVIAASELAPDVPLVVSTVGLRYFEPTSATGTPLPVQLAFLVDVETNEASQRFAVGAATGEILEAIDHRQHAAPKRIFAVDHSALQPPDPADLVCEDPACNCSVDTAGTSEVVCALTSEVYAFYRLALGRDGWLSQPSDPSNRMEALSDFSVPGDLNAAWNFLHDNVEFGDSSLCDSVAAHEWTHGVDHAPDLNGVDVTSDPLDEGLADVMAHFALIFNTGSTDWKMRTSSPACDLVARDLADPGSIIDPATGDFFPDHWSNFPPTGSVHSGATIIGKGAHLLGREPAEGSLVHWGRPVTGIGAADARKIYYDTMTARLTGDATLTEFRMEMIGAATDLFEFGTQVIQTTNMTEAIGLWTPDVPVDHDTDKAIGAAYFAVNGQNRRWLFYKDVASDALMYTYRTCTNYGLCSWQPAAQLGSAETRHSFGVSVFADNIFVSFANASDGAISYVTIDAAGTISPVYTLWWPLAIFYTESDVGSTVAGGYLYVFWRKPGSFDQPIEYVRLALSGQWQSVSTVPTDSTSGSGIGVTSDPSTQNVWIAYRKFGVTGMIEVRSASGTSWSPIVTVPAVPANDGRPGIAFYRGRLHLAMSRASDQALFYASCRANCAQASDCTDVVKQDGGGNTFVSLDSSGAADGRLYMWHRGHNSDGLWWRYKNSE